MKNVMITGSSGFIGKHATDFFKVNGYHVIKLRHEDLSSDKAFEISKNSHKKIDYIIHLAARNNDKDDKWDDFFLSNVLLTEKIVKLGIRLGARKILFLSTLKVHGDYSFVNCPLKEDSKIDPYDSYSKSKAMAEEVIKKLCPDSRLDYVILRPPLVYGKGVKGNFMSIAKLIENRIPMPIEDLKMPRSILSVNNLLDCMKVCLENPIAANKTYLVADDKDISFKNLTLLISKGMEIKPLTFNIPRRLIKLLLFFLGKKNVAMRIIEPFQADISLIKDDINWSPKLDSDSEIVKLFK